MADVFVTGDTVALRSGAAVMTIRNHITGRLAAEQGWPTDAGYVICDWLDADGRSNHQKFHPDQIERVVRVTDFKDAQPVHYWAFADMHGFPVGASATANEQDLVELDLDIARKWVNEANDAA